MERFHPGNPERADPAGKRDFLDADAKLASIE
jgi:hypothetical protein